MRVTFRENYMELGTETVKKGHRLREAVRGDRMRRVAPGVDILRG